MIIKKYSSLLILAIFILALTGPSLVFGEVGGNSEEIQQLNSEIEQRKNTIKQLEEAIEKYKKSIEQKQTEASSLKNQLAILDANIVKVTADVELTGEKIKQTSLEIEALQLSIKDKEAVIARQKKLVAKIIQNIHADQERNYLEIMLTNGSFAEFYDKIQYKMSVYTDLGRSVKILRLTKEDLESKKSQIERKKLSYEKLKVELEENKERLEDQQLAKQDLLVQTRFSEMKYKTLLASLKQEYQSVEGEIRKFEEQVRKKLEAQDKLIGAAGDFFWPVPSRVITAKFHDPDYPFRRVFEHSGTDIRASQGTPVKAANSGYVGRARKCSLASCYSYILLIHTGNLSSLYGHLSLVNVEADQFVNKGDIIGYSGGKPGTVGAGSFVTGPHLHFEIRQNGIPVDAEQYLP
ncbi:MAG: peptidoglycan DD-metalloendopeptidase family protein [Patescibacteria group bacterium]